MNRRRARASSSALSGAELYETLGDSQAARADLLALDSPAARYNAAILAHQDTNPLRVSLEDKPRNRMIVAYNDGLLLFGKGEYHESLKVCSQYVLTAQAKPDEEHVLSRMGFLWIECVLALHLGKINPQQLKEWGVPSVPVVFAWLDSFDSDKDPQFKFLLALYKSRVDLTEVQDEAKIRSAKKELKSAMEVLQHRLRSSVDNNSVVSSQNSEGGSSTYPQQDFQQHPTGSIVIQKMNQSALSLKAHLEVLKENTKKALVLCQQAAESTVEPESFEAIQRNNLGIVYNSIAKRQLAMHALSKGLQMPPLPPYAADGTVRPDNTLRMLYNSSICAWSNGNYHTCYECLAACVGQSKIYDQPKCWIRMAEACIAIFHDLNKNAEQQMPLRALEVDGEPRGLIVDHSLCAERVGPVWEALVPVLASEEDLEQVRTNPLLRAHACLEHVLADPALSPELIVSVRVSLTFVLLHFREYRKALETAEQVIDSPEPPLNDTNEVSVSLRRHKAIARMYAAEAVCVLGDPRASMKFLAGEGDGDALDRLASDMAGGITLNTADSNGESKRRLAQAQSMVRASASAATAAAGNLTAAKQLAMSAQALEDANEANRVRSSARRALVYCLLRGGNHAAALTMLRAMQN